MCMNQDIIFKKKLHNAVIHHQLKDIYLVIAISLIYKLKMLIQGLAIML